MHRVVHIPIEKKHRELMSKLLVALELTSRGVPVIIGHSRAMFANAKHLLSGVMFLKGMNRVQHDIIVKLLAIGHKPVACDEEAMGARGPLLVKDTWAETQPLMAKVFCQGAEHRDVLMATRGFTADQLAVTGNPRIDLLRSPFIDTWRRQAAEITRENGPFVLVNTDMSATNSRFHDLDHYRKVLVQIGWLDPTSEDDRRLLGHHLNHDQSNMDAVSNFARAMAASMPEGKIVLRPHPAEDERRWRDLARETGNLRVVTDSEPVPWLLAARGLVHTGCTTGVEAAILGKPSIALITDRDDNPFSDYRLSNAISRRVTTIQDAVEVARTLLADHPDPDAATPVQPSLEAFLDIDDEAPAFEKIARELESLLPREPLDSCGALRRVPPNIDKYLKATFDVAAKAEGFSEPDEMDRRIDMLLQSAGRPTWSKPEIRDLDWGLYALLPKMGGEPSR